MRIYIAGPISRMPDLNRTSFATAERCLVEAGHTPVNPHKLHGGKTDLQHHEYMRTCVAELVKCDAIHLMPGWGRSKGARLEREVAFACGIVSVRIDGRPTAVDTNPVQVGDGE